MVADSSLTVRNGRALLGRPRQRRARWPTRRARGCVHPIYVSVGLAWEAEERRRADAPAGAPPFARACAPLRDARRSRCATSTRRRTGRFRGVPPAFDTPDEDVYLVGRNVVLLTKAAIYCAAQRHLPHRARPAGRQSVSRCDAGVLRGDGAGAVARTRAPDDDRRAVCATCTRRRDQAAASSSACRSS